MCVYAKPPIQLSTYYILYVYIRIHMHGCGQCTNSANYAINVTHTCIRVCIYERIFSIRADFVVSTTHKQTF